MKQKTRKAIEKRIKVTATGKLLRRHQFGAGHLKRKKSKGALGRHRKSIEITKGDTKAIRRALGI